MATLCSADLLVYRAEPCREVAKLVEAGGKTDGATVAVEVLSVASVVAAARAAFTEAGTETSEDVRCRCRESESLRLRP